jgi:hypothetical protein
LTFLLSEHAGDNDVEAYVDHLISVWKKIYSIPAALANVSAPVPGQTGGKKAISASRAPLLLNAPVHSPAVALAPVVVPVTETEELAAAEE